MGFQFLINWKTFNKFIKLRKDFGKLNDKLIIQHVDHIHIRTFTYTMNSSNCRTFKNTSRLSFPLIQEFVTFIQKSTRKVTNIYKCNFFYADRGPTRTGCGLCELDFYRSTNLISCALRFFFSASQPITQV